MIRLAKESDLQMVLQITRDTILKIYPKYYSKGVVDFFIQHHKEDNVLEDIESGRVWLLEDEGYFVGTVTIKENAVNRLFVLPEYQSHGFGSQLMDFAEDKIAENYSQIVIDSSLAAKSMYLKRGYREKRTCKIEVDYSAILVYDEMEKQIERLKGGSNMKHKVKVTVIDKKLYPELQQQYCADPSSGICTCYNIGDEFVFYRDEERDDFWHMGIDTLVKTDGDSNTIAGGPKLPFCSEAWDAIARYIYTGLQGGSIMKGWMKEENTMITCCSDGTRPVIFKIERIDYE